MNKRISIFLTAIILAATLFVGCNSQNSPSENAGETVAPAITATEPETEAPTEDPLAGKTAEDFVSPDREYEASYSSGMILHGGAANSSETTLCRLPQLSADLPAAAPINQEIHDKFDQTFDEYTTLEEEFIPVNWIDYRCYLNSSVLSLIIESRTTNTPNSFFYVYNVNVISGETLSNNEVISRSTVSSDEAYEMLSGVIETKYEDISVSEEMIEGAKSRTLDSDNLKSAQFYFNEDGKLAAAYRYEWFAGAADYGDIGILDAEMEKTDSSKENENSESQADEPTESLTEAAEEQTDAPEESDYSAYLGTWKYVFDNDGQLDEDHAMVTAVTFNSINGTTANITIFKGNISKVCEIDVTAEIIGGKIDFSYEKDGWMNSGHGTITLNGDSIHLYAEVDSFGKNARMGLVCDDDLTR